MVIVGLLSGIGAAQAATPSVMPLSSQGCNDNVCIQLSGNAGGTALVEAWARNTTFTGTMRLTGPNGVNKVKSGTWKGGKGNFANFTVSNAKAGQYCVNGTSNSSGNEGTPCETLKKG